MSTTSEAGKYLRAANMWWRCAQYSVIASCSQMSRDNRYMYMRFARQVIGRVLSHCNIMANFIRFLQYFNNTYWTIIKGKYPRFNWT